jgi:predicted dehydrogenase
MSELEMNPLDRRNFIGTSAAGLGYFYTASATSAAKAADSPSGKLRIASIGTGGKGKVDLTCASKHGDVVALCNIDESKDHLGWAKEKWPAAKTFFDFRKLYDEMMKQIDVVIVATPDHTHALASLLGIREKKHVYCQKPLTHSIFEARQMRLLAKKYGVCTQMGNQGTCTHGLRRGVEIIQGGVLGKITELHVWTNRPVWPQAPDVMARPPEKPVPAGIHWDEFIGPAPMRPYATYEKPSRFGQGTYHAFNWRGWWDFGTGALGDMACHTANMAFMGLKLGSPTSVSAEAGDVNPETCPSWAHVKFDFPARETMAPVAFHWYEGKKDGKKVLPPEELIAKILKPGQKLVDSGSIVVGEKGLLYSPNDYGGKLQLMPEADFAKVNQEKPEKLPMNPGNGSDDGQHAEFFEAIKQNKPEVAFSNFEYAGMLTEAILLGNIAIRTGKKFEWDAANMKCVGVPEADQYIKTAARPGWGIDGIS